MTNAEKEELTAIDRQLLHLLQLRTELVERLGTSAGLPYQVSRELLSQWVEEATRPLAAVWLQHAASLSERRGLNQLPIAYLGPIYSFSYLAAVKYFGMGADLAPVATIGAAFDEILRRQASFAVVPIENNTDGRIVDTLGTFAKSPVKICGEVELPIHHCLLGRNDRSTIREIHSKPQALSQCRGWLSEHLPEAVQVEVSSTAMAAAAAAKDDSIAAIASREAGIHHGCRVLAENIEDNSQNITRFAIIGHHECPPSGNDKTSLMFQLQHRPGALADAMLIFKSTDVNLTWIESFPLPSRSSEYLFFVELDGHQASSKVRQAIDKLRLLSERLDVLGSYPKGQ